MELQYKSINQLAITRDDLAQWAASRETSEVVAHAIHAIAGKNRAPESIWAAPTPAEWDHVQMAVENYIDNGLYESQDVYYWGEESFSIDSQDGAD